MKKNYEKPTVTEVSFQSNEELMIDASSGVIETPIDSLPDVPSLFSKADYQIRP